jgi:site-specific recombinase XerC
MSRRRGQRKGYLRAENGSWLLTYRKYVWDPDARKTVPQRVTEKIGPAPDPPTRRCKNGELTEKQAQRFAWDHFLSKIDNATVKPFSTITFDQFWEQRYKIHLERKRKHSTKGQYKSLWKVWIQPVIGHVRLFEIKPDQVDAAITRALAAKKGTATVKHIRKVVSAIIEHARTLQMFTGENPARLIELPAHVQVRRQRAMDLEQCRAWLAIVTDEPADPKDRRSDIKPMRTMSLLGLCCSLGVSEQLGFQWQHFNLTESSVLLDGELIEPFSAAVREHSYRGRPGTLKHGHRRRNIPLPKVLMEALNDLRSASKWTAPTDPVFAGESGKAIWTDNLAKRVLKPKAIALGMPWLSWNILRHTCATLTKSFVMLDVDRRALQGHGDQNMTDRYTHEDWERMRTTMELIASEITKPPKRNEPDTTPANVVVMKRRKISNSDTELTRESLQPTRNTGTTS